MLLLSRYVPVPLPISAPRDSRFCSEGFPVLLRAVGRPQSLSLIGMVLTNGLDEIYGELCGREAEVWDKMGGVPENKTVTADLRTSVRSYTTKDGSTRYETRVIIREINVFLE